MSTPGSTSWLYTQHRSLGRLTKLSKNSYNLYDIESFQFSPPGRRWARHMGHVACWYSIHFSKQPLCNRWPQLSQLTTDSGSNRFKHTQQSAPRFAEPNLTGSNLSKNWSLKLGSTSTLVLIASGCEEVRREVKMHRKERIRSLRRETERAVFATRRIRIPSDGDTWFESPISNVRSGTELVEFFSILNEVNELRIVCLL